MIRHGERVAIALSVCMMAIGSVACAQERAGAPSGLIPPPNPGAPSAFTPGIPVTWQTQKPQWIVDPKTGIGHFGIPAAPTAVTTPAAGSSTPASTLGAFEPFTPNTPRHRNKRGFMPAGTTAAGAGATKAPQKAGKSKDEVAIIAESPANKATSTQWQRFENWVSLKDGQEQLNLTMTFNNGEGGPAYSQIKLMLSGRQIATQKEFTNNRLMMSMNGALGSGDNQLVISALGPVGAQLHWKLAVPRPVISGTTPAEAGPRTELTIAGKNFAENASLNSVTVGGQQVTIKSAKPTSLVVTVPDGLKAGDQDISVSVAGVSCSKPAKIKMVYGQPEITRCDMYSAPAGYTVTLSGKGFSASQGDNAVTVGGVAAQVVSASTSSISFVMPDVGSVVGTLPVVVKTNGVQAKGNVQIMGSRPMPYDGTSTGVTP